jgi:hypothetical protein
MSKQSKKKSAPETASPTATTSVAAPRPRRRRFPWRFSIWSIVRVVGLLAFVLWAWSYAHGKLTRESWSYPLDYAGDSPQILGWIKAASEGDFVPFCSKIVHRLGAPFTANWNDYPMYEEFVVFTLGLVARSTDVFTASNVGIVLSYLLSALSFYACCRLFRFRREWALATAVLFAFAYYNSWRGLGHLLLSYSFTVPLGVTIAWIITASRRLRVGDGWFWLCVVASLVIGMSNPYNLFMFLQLVVLGLGVAWFSKRWRRDNALTAGAVILAAAAGFLSMNLDTITYALAHGSNKDSIPRIFLQTELGSLKPIEFVVPPTQHRVTAMADLGRFYTTNQFLRSETFSPYLGIVGIAALAWVAGEWVVRTLRYRDRKAAKPSLHLPACTWIVLYAVCGGLGAILALAEIYLFRSSNRYSIFISAIVLFFLASRMTRLAPGMGRPGSWLLAAAVTTFGLLDQLPPAPSPVDTEKVAESIRREWAFGKQLDSKLAPGTMVFQLPVMRFPEGGPAGEIQEYDMLKPFFVTHNLRFSFGSCQGRPREAWQAKLTTRPISEGVKELESYGFGAVYIARRAFQDRGDSLLKEFTKAGKTELIEDEAKEQVVILLNPTGEHKVPATINDPMIIYKSGWSLTERQQNGMARRWAKGDSTVTFINEQKSAIPCRLTCVIVSLSPRRVKLVSDRQVLATYDLKPNEAAPVDIQIVAKPGRNTLTFETDAPAEVPPGNPQAPRLTHGVANLEITSTR